MKYRKKPVVIEAWHFLGPGKLSAVPPPWINPTWFFETIEEDFLSGSRTRGDSFLMIPTPEGTMRASIGDWIIQGVKGEVYPCKPDIFEATYTPETEGEQP